MVICDICTEIKNLENQINAVKTTLNEKATEYNISNPQSKSIIQIIKELNLQA